MAIMALSICEVYVKIMLFMTIDGCVPVGQAIMVQNKHVYVKMPSVTILMVHSSRPGYHGT